MEVMAAMAGSSMLNCAQALSTSPRFEECLGLVMNLALRRPHAAHLPGSDPRHDRRSGR